MSVLNRNELLHKYEKEIRDCKIIKEIGCECGKKE